MSEVYGMPCGDENPSFRRCLCHKPKDHLGPHWDDCGATWPNLAEMTPCTSSEVAVLGVVGEPARVRCGKLDGHDGDHIFVMTWSGRTTTNDEGSE